jgi:hypothetical protein
MGTLMAEFDEDSLKALIGNEINAAERYADAELSDDRERAIDYMNGRMPDTPRMEGRSSFVSRDTSDIIGWVLPSIMRVFTASDRIVDFEPENEEDEAFCDQAADYINYVFWSRNCGYKIMWDATHDALSQKDGYVKQYWDVDEQRTFSVHTGLTVEAIELLASDDGAEIVEQEEGDVIEQETPEGLVPVQTFNIKLQRTTKKGRLVYETVEPENFLRNRDAIDLKTCRFQAHRNTNLTRSDLIEMGFDREVVDELPRFNTTGYSAERMARDGDNSYSGYDLADASMDRIDLYECYIRVDINDDGVAETVRAYYAGSGGAGELLSWEEWDDETPFDKIPCTPVPHRWDSDSLADETMDIQQFKTVIGRQFFDNIYATNLPQPVVEKGAIENLDALVNPGFGVPIIKKAGAAPIQWNNTPFVADKALAGLEYLDRVAEMRTGVSRATMALDPETLQNQTATASQNQRDSAYSQVELIARNQAELGWKAVFQKSLRITVKNQDRATTIRLRGKWTDVDPRFWNSNMDACINVGLGTGSRDRDMGMLNAIGQSQLMLTDRLAGAGFMEDAIDMVPKIVKTFTKIAEASGIKNPDAFYPQIDDEKLAQMKQQAAEQANKPDEKAQADMQKAQADMQLKQQELQIKAQQSQEEMALKREQMQQEMLLRREQMAAEFQLKREQMTAELQMKRELGLYSAVSGTSGMTSQVHIGGEPG